MSEATNMAPNQSAFACYLEGVDVIFHTATFFGDNCKGGKHSKEPYEVHVTGTSDPFSHANRARVRRFVHTSSVVVLVSKPGQLIDYLDRKVPGIPRATYSVGYARGARFGRVGESTC